MQQYLDCGVIHGKVTRAFVQQVIVIKIFNKTIKPPVGGIEKRRASFYQRNGFSLNQWGYVQQTLAKRAKPSFTCIMSYPKPLQEQEYQTFKNWVFKHVYSNIRFFI
ncbi:hypothetical protein R4Z10_09010 [Niallia sp. XMNu-256]|uniref:hypothetical protein n=1 Tax=Niallia sp. XMNu-256 TaxID=3082444 RepID=UPI0030D2059D